RDDDDGRLSEICRVVPDMSRDAPLAQTLEVGALRSIRALHLIAEIGEHLGDPRHADAADADEVDGAELFGEFHSHRLCHFERPVRRTRSASRSAASGMPAPRARAAMSARREGADSSSVSMEASPSGVNCGCGKAIAALIFAREA